MDFDVSTAGSDTVSCGVDPNPNCKTIGFAIGTRATAAPDNVLVMDGTYSSGNNGESFPVLLKNGVSVTGNVAMPANVILRGPNNIFERFGPLSASTVISGLTIVPGTSPTASSSTAIGVYSLSGSDEVKPVIENNRFIGGGTGVDIHNTSTANSVDIAPTIRDNFFSGQTFAGVHLSADESGTAQKLQGMISSNTIDSAQEGILVEGSEQMDGLIAPTIRMNTINDAVQNAIEVTILNLNNTSNSITLQPTIDQNTITNPGEDSIDVELGLQSDFFASNVFIRYEPTITGNTITGNGSGDAGICVQITDLSTFVTGVSVTADITITGNSVSGMGGPGIEFDVTNLDAFDSGTFNFSLTGKISDNPMISGNGGDGILVLLDDWSDVHTVNLGAFEINGNTVSGNGGAGIAVSAIDINTSAAGFNFSPTIANNTVTGNTGTSTGIRIHYSDSGADGTALLSGNTITGNDGTGVLLLFGGAEGQDSLPVNIALRGNTITGNSGDAIKISGTSNGTSATAPAALQGVFNPGIRGARPQYEVDLGGGFMGGDGLNIIQGNTASGAGGTCANGGFCDINNVGPEDVAAQCNQFTANDVVTEEDWLNDTDDEVARGDIDPISICTPTATPTATPTTTPTSTPTATPTNTLIPDGVDCVSPSECASGFCVDAVCCENACSGASAVCNLSGQEGLCIEVPAPAPAASTRGLIFGIALLLMIAGLSLTRMRARRPH